MVKEFEKAANFQGRPPQLVADRKRELVAKLNTFVAMNREAKKNLQQKKELLGDARSTQRRADHHDSGSPGFVLAIDVPPRTTPRMILASQSLQGEKQGRAVVASGGGEPRRSRRM